MRMDEYRNSMVGAEATVMVTEAAHKLYKAPGQF